MSALSIPGDLRAAIHAHAAGAYPAECCGLGTARRDAPDRLLRWYPCENAQDRFHAQDPARFPRRAANAYFIDPGRLLQVLRDARRAGEILRLIVHSHCDAPVYFSAEDERHALYEGEPVHPGADHLVLSVTVGGVVDQGLFQWERGRGFRRKTTS